MLQAVLSMSLPVTVLPIAMGVKCPPVVHWRQVECLDFHDDSTPLSLRYDENDGVEAPTFCFKNRVRERRVRAAAKRIHARVIRTVNYKTLGCLRSLPGHGTSGKIWTVLPGGRKSFWDVAHALVHLAITEEALTRLEMAKRRRAQDEAKAKAAAAKQAQIIWIDID